MAEEKKYNSLYEYVMEAAKTVWEHQKGGPARYTILSPKQIERLEKGESEFEMGTGTVPFITREQYLKDKANGQRNLHN